MPNSQLNIADLLHYLQKSGAVVFLESQMAGHPSSSKSYLAGKPSAWIKATGGSIEIMENGKIEKIVGNPWKALKKFHCNNKDWLFGYLGYDLKNFSENLQSNNGDLLAAPDLFFMKPDALYEIDQNQNISCLKGELPAKLHSRKVREDIQMKLSHRITKSAYIKLIERAQQDIYEGDYYEINITHPLVFRFKGDSWKLYQKMKEVGPVPFGGYLNVDGFSVCCSSPERFLAKKGDRVFSQPIKGTAARNSPDEVATIQRLKNSEKERAENLMIVDLVRNDLGRLAKNGTVRVKDLFEIQSFETVHQMVSTVECEVEPEVNNIELLEACFPMGSMTGAPKIAAMKAIEKYEVYKRGIYSGAMGYLAPNGDFDFNVIIRSAIIKNQKLVYPVGGAITSDSNPEEEWEETLVKAKAITNINDISISA